MPKGHKNKYYKGRLIVDEVHFKPGDDEGVDHYRKHERRPTVVKESTRWIRVLVLEPKY